MRRIRFSPTPSAGPAVSAPAQRAAQRAGKKAVFLGWVKELSRYRKAVWTVILLGAGVIASVALIVLYTDFTWSAVTEWIDRLNPVAVIPLMALLPIAGFPIAVV